MIEKFNALTDFFKNFQWWITFLLITTGFLITLLKEHWCLIFNIVQFTIIVILAFDKWKSTRFKPYARHIRNVKVLSNLLNDFPYEAIKDNNPQELINFMRSRYCENHQFASTSSYQNLEIIIKESNNERFRSNLKQFLKYFEKVTTPSKKRMVIPKQTYSKSEIKEAQTLAKKIQKHLNKSKI